MLRSWNLCERAGSGIASVEGRLSLKWRISDAFYMSLYCAMVGNVNSSIQHEWDEAGDSLPDYYKHDYLVYGGLVAGVEF